MTDDNEPPPDRFTLEERAQLREMMLERERAKWLWGSVGVWLKWLGIIGGAVVAGKLLLGDTREVFRTWLTK